MGSELSKTWDQAAERWLREQAHKSAIESDRFHIQWMDRFLSGRELHTISKALISDLILTLTNRFSTAFIFSP
jgi:hypothetical protein